MSDAKRIGFIGLGVMGGPMALHLVRAGHSVTVFNRSEEREKSWRDTLAAAGLSATVTDTRAAAARDADILFLCVGDDDDARMVLEGEGGVLEAMREGALLVDHTTTSPAFARETAAAATARGMGFLDAPVSGGQAGAEKGALAIMCGGEAAAVEHARPVMEAYGARIVHVGPAGAGQTAKMANQMCIAGVLGGLAEAVRLTQAAGLDVERTLEAIGGGAAQSWQMENRWHSMHEGRFDFGFRDRLDAQGSRLRAGRSGQARPGRAGHRAGRPVLRRTAGRRAWPQRYERAGRAAA